MKASGYFLVFLILINFSCTKLEKSQEVYFHGRITMDCSNQIPAKNCDVSLSQETDEFKNKIIHIADWQTDEDGNYAFSINVKQYNSFKGYILDVSGSGYFGGNYINYANRLGTTDNNTDIEISGPIYDRQYFKFHIKNTNPINEFDVLNSLQVYELGNNAPLYNLSNHNIFTGIDVDETTIKFIPRIDNLVYKYSVTKNNIETISDPLPLPQSNCMDTVLVDVFY